MTPTKLEIFVDPQTAKDIEDLISERGWEQKNGRLLLIGAGLMAAKLQPLEDDESDTKLPDKARTRWLKVEASLAVARFRLFEAEQANRNWEMSVGAIRSQNVGYEVLLKQKEKKIEELERVIAKLAKE